MATLAVATITLLCADSTEDKLIAVFDYSSAAVVETQSGGTEQGILDSDLLQTLW